MTRNLCRGMVVLVGAGPGDPRLITVEALRWLARADVVLYDRLAPAGLLKQAPPRARRVYAGKSSGDGGCQQEQINRRMIEEARAGRLVVRLKGGDPFIFGRGGEEAGALSAAGVPFRVVPGITAAAGAAAWAGLPLTDRRLASSVALVTAREDAQRCTRRLNYTALAGIDTLVFYMGVKTLAEVADGLIAAGKPADTPAVIIERATTPGQRTLQATLGTLAQVAAAHDVRPPAVTVVGPTAAPGERLDWRAKLPLAGRTVVVTRPAKQSAWLGEALGDLGAAVLAAPAVEIAPIDDAAPLDAAIDRLGQYAWVCFTSRHGVAAFVDRLAARGMDGRALGGVRLSAVGPGTAEALAERFLRPDLLPERYTGTDLAAALAARGGALSGRRVLLARADIARPELPAALRAAGALVDDLAVYRTVCPPALPPEAVTALDEGRVDWITFTSGSTVEHFLKLAPSPARWAGARLASIGPTTSSALADHGLSPAVEARPHTSAGLLTALLTAEEATA